MDPANYIKIYHETIICKDDKLKNTNKNPPCQGLPYLQILSPTVNLMKLNFDESVINTHKLAWLS